jgi:glycine/D-amino acid oxidase-like deaminating enzyme
MEGQQKFDFAIIGGGVYGLSIAYHLAKTQKTIALF